MNQSDILPWKFAIGKPSRRNFSSHLKTLPKQYRKEALGQMYRSNYPCKSWPSLTDKITALMIHPRIKSCTESSNVALAHAVDSAALNPTCANSGIKLLKEVELDQMENPRFW